MGALVLASAVASAQSDRTQYFIDLLGTSTSFSVRAQAALALGRVPPSNDVRTALTAALRDEAPAVRAAAASAIQRQADTQLLATLRSAVQSERDPTVRDAERRAIASLESAGTSGSSSATASTGSTTTPRSTGTPRYYVAIGQPGDNSSALSATQVASLQRYITDQVGGVEGVVLAPAGETPAAGTRALRSNRLVGYFIDASVVSVEEAADGTSARVSVILATYPGRDMRAMLSGSARVPNARGADAVQRAVQGAVQGALRRLSQAMEASGARASR
ncbi:MAG: HEAT repeat domain-containing protein [Polyangiales bacterium]|nr:HEAT repeat domain-containing protein [Sandaracinaceae bacterium]